MLCCLTVLFLYVEFYFQEDPLYPLLSVLAPDGDIVLVTLTNRKDAKKFLDGIQGKTMAQLAALSPGSSADADADDATDMPKKTKVIQHILSICLLLDTPYFDTF